MKMVTYLHQDFIDHLDSISLICVLHQHYVQLINQQQCLLIPKVINLSCDQMIIVLLYNGLKLVNKHVCIQVLNSRLKFSISQGATFVGSEFTKELSCVCLSDINTRNDVFGKNVVQFLKLRINLHS